MKKFSIKYGSESHDKMLKYITGNYEKGKTEYIDFWNDIEKWNKLYEGKTDESRVMYTGMADVSVPEIFKAVQTLKARIMSYLGNFFELVKKPGIKIELIDAYTKFIKQQHKDADLEIELEKLIITALKYGTGICKIYWEEDYKEIIKPVSVGASTEAEGILSDEAGEPVITYADQTIKQVKGYPKLKNLNWRNIIIIGNTDDFKRIDCVIERIENVPWENIWALRKQKVKIEGVDGEQEIGVYENLEEAKTQNLLPPLDNEKEIEYTVHRVYGPEYNSDKEKKDERITETSKHTLLECWGYYDINDDGIMENCIMTVLDNKIVIRCHKNPYNHQNIPYLVMPCTTKENDFFGIGVCQMTAKLQNELNARRNQTLDSATGALCNMWIRRDQSIPDNQLKFRPNGIIDSIMPDGIKKLDTQMMNLNAGNMTDAMIKDDIQTTSAANKSMQGNQLNAGTATEVRSLVTEGNYRVIDIVKNLEKYILRKFMEMHLSMNEQFVEEAVVVDIPVKGQKDENGNPIPSTMQSITLSKNDMMIGFEPQINVVTEVENKTIKIQQMQNFLGILSGLPLPPPILMPLQFRAIKAIAQYMDNTDITELTGDQQEMLLSQMLMPQQVPGMPGQPGAMGPQGSGNANRAGTWTDSLS